MVDTYLDEELDVRSETDDDVGENGEEDLNPVELEDEDLEDDGYEA